jgi:hypothetical protein
MFKGVVLLNVNNKNADLKLVYHSEFLVPRHVVQGTILKEQWQYEKEEV